MNGEKITISLDDINSAQVDVEIKRQEIATRMAAHQSEIESTTRNSNRMNPSGIFRRSMVYMAIFGLIASLIGWGLGEIAQYKVNNNPLVVFRECLSAYLKLAENPTDQEFTFRYKALCRSGVDPRVREDNPYFLAFLDEATIDARGDETAVRIWNKLWYILLSIFVSIGLAIAEPVVSKNMRSTLLNGALGAVLGCLGGFLVSLFVNDVYLFLGGAQETSGFLQQMFARGIGWSILGLFVAIAPGILMRSWKKLVLGLIGGAIGGLLGGLLFDLLCRWPGSVVLARCVNIVGLGLGAALATTFLENLAKQGWLRVATGVITGKQFILYRNPTVIGSSPKCEIYLFKDPTVAARHAAINGLGGKFIVTALGGATVLVNGTPAHQQTLKNGDTIKVGSTLFFFEARVNKNVRR